jgi:hypothetical protein
MGYTWKAQTATGDKGSSIKNLDRGLAGFDFVCGLCSDAEEEYIQIDQYVKHALVLSFVGLFAQQGAKLTLYHHRAGNAVMRTTEGRDRNPSVADVE